MRWAGARGLHHSTGSGSGVAEGESNEELAYVRALARTKKRTSVRERVRERGHAYENTSSFRSLQQSYM
jgi:hypothetical protein